MGSIYVNATSVTVGPGLAPTLPAADYCSRAWCYQERMFGRVLYVWDFDQIDETKLVAYAKEAALSLGNLESVSRTIAATVTIPSSEDWRLGSLRRVMREHPDTAPYGQQVLDNWTHRSADTVRLLAKLILKIRENANCVAEENYADMNTFMFDCTASFAKDRLYGIWGVSLYKKNLGLNYMNPVGAWREIVRQFPETNYAFYASLSQPHLPFGGFRGFATVEQVVFNLLECGKTPLTSEITCATRPLGAKEVVLEGVHFGLVWNADCVAVGWDPEGPFKSFHLVVSKECLLLGKTTKGESSFNKKFINLKLRLKTLGADMSNWAMPFKIKGEMVAVAESL